MKLILPPIRKLLMILSSELNVQENTTSQMESKEWKGEGAESGQRLNPYLQDLLNAPKPRDTVLLEDLCGALPNQQRQQTEALKPDKKELSDNKVEAILQRKLFIARSHSLG